MINFSIDYFLYVFILALIVIQLATMKSGLYKLIINKNKLITLIISFILFIISTIIFMYSENRIINDFEGGLDANQQLLIFSAASFSAFIATCILTSVYRKSEDFSGFTSHPNGLEALSKYNFIKLQLLKWNRFKNST